MNDNPEGNHLHPLTEPSEMSSMHDLATKALQYRRRCSFCLSLPSHQPPPKKNPKKKREKTTHTPKKERKNYIFEGI